MTPRRQFAVATVNVNGLRAASANGMAAWARARTPDLITMQEVRAPDELVPGLVDDIAGPGLHVVHAECAAKGRAGVAVVSRQRIVGTRTGLWHRPRKPAPFDDSGRWVEADLETGDGRGLTVISCYVHTGDADSPERMAEKLAFLDAAADRLQVLHSEGRHVLLTGDLNVAHREIDLKNWKGNLKRAGFLPVERAWFDRLFGLGWVDVARSLVGDQPGPYSWWSWRGKAFDTDTGWRIDYHIASPELAATASGLLVDRAPSYAERWSDHAPVVITYSV